MHRKTKQCFLFLLIFTLPFLAFTDVMAQDDLPDRLLVGYWHNWGWPNALLLSEITDDFDVIDVAFATPTQPFGAIMQFTPDSAIYPNQQDFIDDVAALQSSGTAVIISIGGANDPVNLNNEDDIAIFVSSMIDIIDTYGFDGVDIDLEGSSLYLEPGDTDFQNPTSPLIVNFIEAIIQLTDIMPNLLLTAAPETAFVQGGYTTYGGIWGAYLPVIHALRNRLTCLHVQHYNTGSMYGRDGTIYMPATADFHVAMADMLLAGFPVDVWGENIYFDSLSPEQVAIGLPASSSAAGSGYTAPNVVQTALDYIILGESFGGQYQLAQPDGYLGFRGLMTWSVNWDVDNDYEFSSTHRAYLDDLEEPTFLTDVNCQIAPSSFLLIQNYPNPFNPSTQVQYELTEDAQVKLTVFNLLGQEVAVLVDESQATGRYTVLFDATCLEAGIYFYQLKAGDNIQIKKMTLIK